MMRPALVLAALVACRPTTAPIDAPTRPPASPQVTAPGVDVPIDETPQPVAVRINGDYTDSDAKKWSKNFEHDGREVFDKRADIVAALALRDADIVADVGAGTGLFTLLFAEKVGKVVAVDVQQYFLDHVAARAQALGLANITTQLADQRRTGLAAVSIDLAFLCDAYHHLELPRTYLADLRRAIRPGGRLVVIDYDRTRPGTGAWMKEHIRADPAELRREIEAAGFTLVDEPKLLRENFFWIFRAPEAQGSTSVAPPM
jgi:SAM-dependent methyltransferase